MATVWRADGSRGPIEEEGRALRRKRFQRRRLRASSDLLTLLDVADVGVRRAAEERQQDAEAVGRLKVFQ